MIVTIDCNTSPREMHHLAVALQRIAAENGYKAPVCDQNNNAEVKARREAVIDPAKIADIFKVEAGDLPTVTVSFNNPDIPTAPVTPPVEGHVVTITNTGPLAPDMVNQINQAIVDHASTTNDNLDSSGLPWDARIHAGSRERNTDGSWRVRRRPKGVEEVEWDATLARVTSELRDLMEIPVTLGAVADAAAETALTDAEVDAFVDIVAGVTGAIDQHGELVSAENVFVAPPVILPPVVVSPPGGYADGDSYRQTEEPVPVVLPPVTITPPTIAPVTTFAQLMVWLTGHTPKDEAAKPPFVARVNEILAANQLTTLQQLGQRAELIPQVLAQFVEAFGE